MIIFGIECVEVELHNTAPECVDATRATMRALVPEGADLYERDGKFYIPTGFPSFAAEQQGYVKKILR